MYKYLISINSKVAQARRMQSKFKWLKINFKFYDRELNTITQVKYILPLYKAFLIQKATDIKKGVHDKLKYLRAYLRT